MGTTRGWLPCSTHPAWTGEVQSTARSFCMQGADTQLVTNDTCVFPHNASVMWSMIQWQEGERGSVEIRRPFQGVRREPAK